MHNSTLTQHSLYWIKGSLLLLCLLFGLTCQQAFALTENNLSCTASGTTGVIDVGDVAPLGSFEIKMTGSCKVTRNFPYGASLSHTQTFTQYPGVMPWEMYGWTASGIQVYNQPWGIASAACLPTTGTECKPLPVGTVVPYEVRYFEAYAPVTPGNYSVTIAMTSTSIKGFETYVDKIQTLILKYRIISPACSMGSSNTLSLPFGTLNSNDFATSQQIANVTLNCTRGTQATASLAPTQTAVSGSPGVSATTLAGLSMAATWADNNTAVTFNSPRTLTLTTGANTIRLGFRPRLNTSISPTGSFTSQYTLNINYL